MSVYSGFSDSHGGGGSVWSGGSAGGGAAASVYSDESAPHLPVADGTLDLNRMVMEMSDLPPVAKNSLYKTDMCQTFTARGVCSFGQCVGVSTARV